MTAASAEEAEAIGTALVAENLAACINILGPITSIYRWQGEIEKGSETAFIAKTMTSRVTKLTERVKELHSYDCPCVISLNIDDGNPDFVKWIQKNIKNKWL